MAINTENFSLKKPAPEDAYSVSDQNTNMDIIDSALHDTKDSTITFEEPQAYTDIASGDSHATLFGKIKAFFKNGIFSKTLMVGSKGTGNGATGDRTASVGVNNSVTGANAMAVGRNLINEADSKFVTGKFNDNKSNNLLEVGNGTSSANRSNAMYVTGDGSTGVGGDLIAYANDPIGLMKMSQRRVKTLTALSQVTTNGLDETVTLGAVIHNLSSYTTLVLKSEAIASGGLGATIFKSSLYTAMGNYASNDVLVIVERGDNGATVRLCDCNTGRVWYGNHCYSDGNTLRPLKSPDFMLESRNQKTYTSLVQLGLSSDATIAQLATAMPAESQITLQLNLSETSQALVSYVLSQISDTDISTGLCNITFFKPYNDARLNIRCINYGSNSIYGVWNGIYNGTIQSPGYSKWYRDLCNYQGLNVKSIPYRNDMLPIWDVEAGVLKKVTIENIATYARNNAPLTELASISDTDVFTIVSGGVPKKVPALMIKSYVNYENQYHVGDKINTTNRTQFSGCLTGGSKVVQFIIPLPKLLGSDITNVTIACTNLIVRGIGGYIVNGVNINTFTANIALQTDGCLDVQLTSDPVLTGTNNTPVAVCGTMTISFT